MTKTSAIFAFLILVSLNTIAQVEWSRCLGGSGHEHFNEIIQLKDGNLISVGDKSPNCGNYNTDIEQEAWIIKLKPNGDTIWSKTFGGNNQDRIHGVIQLNDCSILACGFSYSTDGDILTNRGKSDAWLIKLDLYGNLLWSKTYGGSESEWINSIFQDINNDIFLIGTTFSNDNDIDNYKGSGDIWLLKLDSFGEIIFSKCFGGSQSDMGGSIIEAGANNLLIGGSTKSLNGDALNNHGSSDFLTIKVDKLLGDTVWSNCYGGSQDEYFEKDLMLKVNDNLFVLAGTSFSNNFNMTNNYGNADYAFLKIDSVGNLISSNNYGGSNNDYVTSMIITPDSNLILLGQSESLDNDIHDHIGGSDYWLIKINQDGDTLFSKSFGTTGGDYARTVINTFDFGYILGGFSYGNYCTGSPNGCKDWFIVKLGSEFDFNNNLIVSNYHTYSFCQGDSVFIYENYLSSPGIYYIYKQSALGCDSIIYASVIENPTYFINQDQAICQGDSILLFEHFQSTSGTYYDSLKTINGCDSILSISLIVNALPNVSIANFDPDTICNNANAISLPVGYPVGGNYIGLGVSLGEFVPTIASIGSHNIIYTYSDSNSCVNSDTTVIIVNICLGVDNVGTDFGISIYPNPNTGQFTIEKPSNLKKEVQLRLLDSNSKLIQEKVIPKGKQGVEMDFKNYSEGIYYLHLIINDEQFVKQIIKN